MSRLRRWLLRSLVLRLSLCVAQLLLQLDRFVEKRNVLSETQAAELELFESVLDASEECAVCLCDCLPGSRAVVLACGHAFHTQCVKEWVVKGRDTCPLCNTKVVQEERRR